ncbi:MAG TPA: DUF2723 domain-containing protein [Salinivirgaceae bacterium]|nr:DUF2723 domain-containing protein [Salinivirgaceae bacterium]
MSYKRLNLLGGWLSFLIAAVVYLSTIPLTTSFWDCGEFIASAYRLEVCHPPGSPLFLMLGRIASMFAPSPEYVAAMINGMNALASAFTIMFLFWTITHLAKKLINPDSDENIGKHLAIIGSGFVGALGYMFTDTFWFSAVEGEVYALSSLFTAVVFWAILRWENDFDKPYANRWILLIAYLMGLSIGVHLLNLLAIPAIVLVYYFKKYTPTTKGVIYAILISGIILGGIMYGIIPLTVKIASKSELLFVNSFGLPYKTGFLVFALLLIGGLIYGIQYSFTHKKVILNTTLLSIALIIFGYTSYAMIVIRSNANPPMDQNNPEQMFSLLSYLNREQYGDRPLLYGQVYSAPGLSSTPKISYRQKDGKYVEFINGYDIQYDERFYMLFPRMYSSNESHVEQYKQWGKIKGIQIKVDTGNGTEIRTKPTFGENLRFFFSYQMGFMYFRYFMWNFVGRQNDNQSHGEAGNGNWISGINFIDNIRLGDQTALPESWKNPSANRYYFLPLLFGLFGAVYQYFRNKKDFWVVMLLFVLTGIAIVVYLNQTPLQPRERDYAYAGSTYAFAIWIGLGVLFLYELFNKILNSQFSAIISGIIGIVAVPVIIGAENWKDHDRTGRYMARDFAYNYLNSCDKNALIFTNGDNDTFPIWYIQEVEGVRTDVRVLCLPYLSTDWYIDQLRRQVWFSPPVPFSMDPEKYVMGTRDMVYVFDRKDLFLNEKYQGSEKELKSAYEDYCRLIYDILRRSNFPTLEKATWDVISKDIQSIKPSQLISLGRLVCKAENVEKYKLNKNEAELLSKQTENLYDLIANAPLPIDIAVRFATDDSRAAKLQNGENYIPSRKLLIPVDRAKVIANGTVHPKDTSLIVDKVVFTLSGNILGKADLAMLDIFATNNWERPIYFTAVGSGTFASLQKYTQDEGFAFRLVPIKNEQGGEARINSEILYENLIQKFMYRNLDNLDVYYDFTEQRTLRIVSLRDKFTALANRLVAEGDITKAQEVLKKGFKILPLERMNIDYFSKNVFDVLYKAGDLAYADSITKRAALNTIDELNYVTTKDPIISNGYLREEQMAYLVMQEIMTVLNKNNRQSLKNEISQRLYEKLNKKTPIVSEIEKLSDEDKTIIRMYVTLDQNQLNQWYRGLSFEKRKILEKIANLDEFETKVLNMYALWCI